MNSLIISCQNILNEKTNDLRSLKVEIESLNEQLVDIKHKERILLEKCFYYMSKEVIDCIYENGWILISHKIDPPNFEIKGKHRGDWYSYILYINNDCEITIKQSQKNEGCGKESLDKLTMDLLPKIKQIIEKNKNNDFE